MEKVRNLGRHLVFRVVLFSSDIFFYFTKLRQFLRVGGCGMEDVIKAQMQSMAKDMGIELNQNLVIVWSGWLVVDWIHTCISEFSLH